jgi:AcrR family transcriptional regulator
MPKAFTEQERQGVIERLLAEGYRLFVTYGIRKTSVEELASAAGISKGAFYLFYESKEALFMDVMEQTEQAYRREIMALIGEPGRTPRARLLNIFRKAFGGIKTMPLLQLFSHGDLEYLALRVPPEKIQEHMFSDTKFLDELTVRCREVGIDIVAPPEKVMGLLYTGVFASLQEGAFGLSSLPGDTLDVLLELIAAYCLGEVTIGSAGTPE